jgi:pSer/pThr/pTyr-binding forkhead associated (FHA) protein
MAMLRNLLTGEAQLVEPQHIFGRAPTSSSRVDLGYVSAQHACLRWTSGRWVLRDLGSRNGTYLDGERLNVGEERAVHVGMRVTLGKRSEGGWELINDEGPAVMVLPLDNGEPVLLAGELIAVPSSEDPQVTIYRGTEGEWLLERADSATTPIKDLQTFSAGGKTWRFRCPELPYETSLASAQQDFEVRHAHLQFSVSRDEEHISLRMSCAGRSVDMGSRTHNYVLLLLARQRVDDTAQGLPETSCGWVYQEDLVRGMQIDPQQLNLDVYRLRRQFGASGVIDAANIVERRPRTRQLRIGTSNLSIVRV